MSLFVEFKQRHIWKVVVAYPGLVFILLQVIEFFINNYHWDHRFLTAAIIASVGMLPAAVIWNWRHGEEGKQKFTAVELGSFALFGAISLAAVGWYWKATPGDISPVQSDAPAVRSVLVLPFENVDGDTEVQYLCDGIAESLINWLATVPGVKVVSKSAAFRLRDQAGDVNQLVKDLGVDSVLQGRLEKRGNEVVISASLVDIRDESQLWGERMVQPLEQVLYLERSIVSAIKDSLRLKVSDASPARVATGSTDHPEAYEHYLRGHFLVQSTNQESIQQGLDELREAINLDPKFALPYADIANSMLQMVQYGMDGSEAFKGEARTAAYTAVALAPELAEAQTALATMHEVITFDWKAAEEAYETAVSLSPQSSTPYTSYADFLWATLRFDRAIDMARHGLEIDPKDGNLMHAIGVASLYSGDVPSAVTAFEDWNRFYPGSRWSYVKVALALSLNGQCDAAAEYAQTAERMAQGQGSSLFETWLAWGYQVCGRDELYARIKQKLEPMWVADPDTIETGMAFYRLLEGDFESVIQIMQRTVELQSPNTLFLQIFLLDTLGGPISSVLAEDPRMQDLVRGLNFPPTRWSVTEVGEPGDK